MHQAALMKFVCVHHGIGRRCIRYPLSELVRGASWWSCCQQALGLGGLEQTRFLRFLVRLQVYSPTSDRYYLSDNRYRVKTGLVNSHCTILKKTGLCRYPH